MSLRRAATAALLATTALASSTAVAAPPAPPKRAIDGAAATVAPLPGAEPVQRDVHSFRADGADYVLVLDTAVVGGAGTARMSVVAVDTHDLLMQADGRSDDSTGPRRDPEPPPTPYFVGQGIDQQLCYPGYIATVEDEECHQKKVAAEIAATAICAVGAGAGAGIGFIIGGPLGAVVGALIAQAACETAHFAVDQYKCEPQYVVVSPYCTFVYPRPLSPQAQAAHDEYRRRTGKEPPQPCGPPPADLSRSGSVAPRRNPICE